MIQILCADLSDANEDIYRRLYHRASPERRARANRFRCREDALRCVAAGALLRHVLSEDFRIETGPGGKPFLPDQPDMHFNLSHSGNWVVIAWGSSEVGVDVESLRRLPRIDALIRRYCSKEEMAYILEDSNHREQRFFEVWTGKESILKYLGTGIQTDLRAFSVLAPAEGLHLHRRTLPDGSLLCLCTTDNNYGLKFLNVHQLA